MFGGARNPVGVGRTAALALAAALALLTALALPALAGAASGYEVEGTGDEAKSVAGDECETAAGECTFRAAIEAANDGPDKDRIFFNSAVFHGATGATLVLGSALPAITQPVRIDATPCELGPQAPPFPCVPISAPAGTVGIDVLAGETDVEGLIISGANVGVRLSGAAAGNKVEGNEIHTPLADSNAVAISILNGPNQIYANTLQGTCCLAAIFLQGNANGNKIGGDTAQSENVIDGFQNGAIAMTLAETSRNEVGRNRGLGGGKFIGLFKAEGAEPGFPNQIDPPLIGSVAVPSKIGPGEPGQVVPTGPPVATGTARPGAKVRLFSQATGDPGEVKGFLGQTSADGAGNWKAILLTAPVGSPVTATQTLAGGTSELSASVTVTLLPPSENGSGGGGSGDGGGSTSGGGGSTNGTGPQNPPPAGPPLAPRAKIGAGPAGKLDSTTARFRFTSPVAGSRFQCRLDGAKFSGCRSPHTYRHLEPGRHVFRVRAIGPTGTPGAVVKRVFTVS